MHNNTILGARTLGPASLDLFLVEDTGYQVNYRTIPSPTGDAWTTNLSPTRDGLGFVFSSGPGLFYSDMNFVSGATANLKQLTLFPGLQAGATLETW